MFGVTLFNRDFSKRIQSWWGIKVNWLEWLATGGPSAGLLDVGPAASIADLAPLLRCPVEVWQDGGGLLWWGFVNSLSGCGYHVSLDDMVNSVAASYIYNGSDQTKNGTKVITGYTTDSESVLAYGTKQRVIAVGQASDALAINKRDAYLVACKVPFLRPYQGAGNNVQVGHSASIPAPQPGQGASIAPLQLGLKGWWSTLGWKLFASNVGKIAYTDIDGNLQKVGDVAANTKAAQMVVAPSGGWPSSTIHLGIRAWGAPADNLLVDFCQNSGGVPGAVIGTATLAGGSAPTGLTWYIFNLNASISMGAPGTQYWIVVRRSGAVDPANYYQLRVNEAMGFIGSTVWLWNGAAWVARAPYANFNFALIGLTETTVQLTSMIAASGQFLSGSRFDAVSGVFSCAWRDGSRSALTEVNELLTAGNSGGGRLLATVDRGRLVRISAAPSTPDLVYQADGTVTTSLRSYVDGAGMVGHWARIAGPALLPAGGSVGMARDVWIEGAKWACDHYLLK